MPDFEAVEVLTQAKEKILDHGWGQNTAKWRRAHGDHESYCLEDALCGQRDSFVSTWKYLNPAVGRAADYTRSVIALSPTRDLYEWNDARSSAGEVLDALDAAILVAKEAPTPKGTD